MSVVPTDTVAADSGLAALAPGEAAGVAGQGCHAGKDERKRAAAAAGKSEVLDRYARDYPVGPHDQPQSMCPAF